MSDEVERDDRPSRYEDVIDTDDRGERTVVVYRASSVGGCPRALVAFGLDYDPMPVPDEMQKKFDEGTNWELRLLDRIAKKGVDTRDGQHYKLTLNGDHQHRVRFPVIDGVEVRAALDDVGAVYEINGEDISHPTPCIVEVKFLGDDMYEDFKRKGIGFKPGYAWQVSSQMYGMEHELKVMVPVLFVCALKKRSPSGKLIGIAELTGEWIISPPIKGAEFVTKLTRVEQAIAKQKLPDCEPMYPCPFFYMHDEKKIERLDDELLVSLVAQFENAKRQEKSWEAKRKAAQEGIFGFFESEGIKGGTRHVGDFKVVDVWAEMPERTVQYKASTTHYVKVEKINESKGKGKK